MNRQKFLLFASLVAFVIYWRLADHPANFTPVAAAAIFLTSYLGRKWGALAVLGSMLVTDAVIGFYDWRLMAAVYGSFAAVSLLGRAIGRKAEWTQILGVSILGSILFFLVTNGVVWALTPAYAKTVSGLLDAYVMGLPFFRNTLLGDITFVATFFGLARAFAAITQDGAMKAKIEAKI